MKKSLLLLGSTGKMGTAISRVLGESYRIIPKSSKDFNANNLEEAIHQVTGEKPDVIVNTVGFLGIDNCEIHPEKAFHLNTLLPKALATVAAQTGSILVHFSTDSVFDGLKQEPYVERDLPAPLNIYGATKLAGDHMVAAHLACHYIFRLPIIFGPSRQDNQLTERMLAKAKAGEQLRMADDVVSSPSYSLDVAEEIGHILEEQAAFGLYHLANQGTASLYELMHHLLGKVGLADSIQPVSHREFHTVGQKNTHTPMSTEKRRPLRSWQEAASAYLELLEA